jgi:hypothetical protein
MISSRPGNASAAERSGDNITIRDKISLSFPGILWYLEDKTGNFQITTGREIGAGQSVSILFSFFASSERRTQAFEIAASEEVMEANPGSRDTAKWRRKDLAFMVNAAILFCFPGWWCFAAWICAEVTLQDLHQRRSGLRSFNLPRQDVRLINALAVDRGIVIII